MARRKLIWHIGLAHASQDVIGAGLEEHRSALEESGARVVATPYEARLATYELLRTHREAGVKRSQVEGQWARITDRVWDHKGVSLLSTPDLCVADKDQLRLALDPLIGLEVHLVLTAERWEQQLRGAWLADLRAGRVTEWETYADRVPDSPAEVVQREAEEFWAGHDVDAIFARWGWTFHAERLHVLDAPATAERWSAFLGLAGAGEELPAPTTPLSAEPSVATTLASALQENEQLQLRAGALEKENARLDRKRRKHKKRVKQLRAAAKN